MDHKELVTRFTKACYRFEAIQGDLDILLFDTEEEIKANEYEDLANQAAEIVLKLSANGNNVGEHFYRYYVERLEYIIDYFRALLDYGETPLAEDEENAATDEGVPISEDPPLDRKTKRDLEEYKGWFELSENERQCVLDTLAVYLGLPSAIHEFVCAAKRLQADIFLHEVKRHFDLLSGYKNFTEPGSIRYHEGVLRGRIWKVINGVENFRDSQMYDALVKLYPTYKEELQ